MTETFSPSINPSVGSSGSHDVYLLRAQFQDGYESVAADGINHIRQKWNLSWNVLKATQATELLDFFQARGGYEAFYWTPPNMNAPRLFRCISWTPPIGLGGNQISSIRATFEEVFDGATGLLAVASIDFALSQLVPSWLTFSRGTTATYQNENGILVEAAVNEAVFESISGTCLGLRFESASENLITQSEDFTTGWTETGTGSITDPAAIVSPEGTFNATTLTDSGAGDIYTLWRNIPVADDSGDYIFSIFAKTGTQNILGLSIQFSDGTGTSGYTEFDLSTGLVSDAGDSDAYGVINFGSSWRRVWIRVPNNGAGNETATISIYVGDENSDNGTVHVFGAQFEKMDVPTSYIPTGATTVSRNQDFAFGLMSAVGITSSGSFYCRFRRLAASDSAFTALSFYNTAETQSVEIIKNASASLLSMKIEYNNSIVSTLTRSFTDSTAVQEFSGAFESLNNAFVVNSETITTDPNNNIGTMTDVRLAGFGNSGLRPGNMYIQEVSFYNSRITDTQLQDLI